MFGIISIVKQKENEIVAPAIYEAFEKYGYSKEWVNDPLNKKFIHKISSEPEYNDSKLKIKTIKTDWCINEDILFKTIIIRKLDIPNNKYDVEIKVKYIKNIEEK